MRLALQSTILALQASGSGGGSGNGFLLGVMIVVQR